MRTCLLILTLALLPAFAGAETVYLKDGTRLMGRVTQAGAGGVTVETPDGLLEVKRERIDHIDYTEPGAVPPPGAPTDGHVPAKVKTAEHLNSIVVGLGGTIPAGAHKFNKIAGNGGAFNIEYYRQVHPLVSIGVGLMGLGFGDVEVNTPTGRQKFETGAGEFLFLARVEPMPALEFSPYGVLGVGSSGFHEEVRTTTFANGSTFKSLDDDSQGFALRLGLGALHNFTRTTYAALESNWHWLTTDHEKFGQSSVQAFDLGGRVGFRF
jgi:hypothetical protein